MFKFWWRSGSRIRIWIRIATLVRRALAEVGTVPVLLVYYTTRLDNIGIAAFYTHNQTPVVADLRRIIDNRTPMG